MAKAKCWQCGDAGFFFSKVLRSEMVCPCMIDDAACTVVPPLPSNTPTGRPAVDSLAEFCGVTPAEFRRCAK